MSNGMRAALALCLLGGVALAQQPPLMLTDSPANNAPPPPVVVYSAGPAFTADCDDTSPRLWGGVEYLLWWSSRPHIPALVTSGDPLDATPGAFGQPGTSLLYGESRVSFNAQHGVRANLGGWLDPDGRLGVEATAFFLQRKETGFSTSSDAAGNPPVYFPLFRTDVGTEGSFTVSSPQAFPGLLTGNAAIRLTTRFWGADLSGVVNVWSEDGYQVDLIGGFRYLHLLENLYISALGLNDPVFNIQQTTHDQFTTRNQFYGGQGGVRVSGSFDGLTAALKVQLAMGTTYQTVGITGASTQAGTGVVNGNFAGGVFTQPSNISRIPRNAFTVVPQVGGCLGYSLVEGLQVYVGYDFLYWGRVVHPGDQVDRSVNLSQQFGEMRVGAGRPAPLFDRTEFYAHGLSAGVLLEY